jgi:type III secretion protein J
MTIGRAMAILPLALVLSGCLRKEIQTGLSEPEAQEIIVVLKDHGLDAVTQRSGNEKAPSWTVYVKGGDQNLVEAWRILRENGLPRIKDKGLEQVFANSGMIPTATEERARLIAGLAGEMSNTLKSVDGVVDARVHVVLPDNSPLLDRSQWSPTTASVLVKYRGNEPPLKEADLRNLVARGVEGLQTDNVAIVFERVRPKPSPARDLTWYSGNQEVLVVCLNLLVFTSLASLLLIARSRRQRLTIEELRSQLKAASEAAPQVRLESAGSARV